MSNGAQQEQGTTGRPRTAWWIRWSLPLCSVVGVLAAFAVVLAWFPRGEAVWQYPLQQIDAPAHYYFIRKILDEGIGAATHLWPNDAYYPPMFHLLAAGLVAAGNALGWHVSIYTAFNVVWLVGAGLIWPSGMQLFAGYWTRRVDHGRGEQAMRPFACAMAVLVPVLAVVSPCHPYQMLLSGPLIAYGLATSLLPFWLYVTLRLFDAIAARRMIIRWLVVTLVVGGLCLFAHPRIAFTWLLLMGPFVLLRLPWKLIVAMIGAVAVCAVAFLLYMMSSYRSNRYFDPSSWFHTFEPNRTVPDALRVYLTENLTGAAAVIMAVAVVLSVVVTVITAIRPRLFAERTASDATVPPASAHDHDRNHDRWHDMSTRGIRKDAIALVLSFLLVGLVYVCSTALTGWFPNIVTAAWYRAETRPLTMIPFGVVPLIIFAACMIGRSGITTASIWKNLAPVVSVAVTAIIVLGCLLGDTSRSQMSDTIRNNFTLDDQQPTEQLTQTKYEILKDVSETVEPDATIISDPLNGSMYGMAAFGSHMLYPIYNPMAEKNGAIFGDVERAFDSGDSTTLLNTVCPINPDAPEYFLTMGPQADSLQMFTFKEQYDPFHRQDLIDQYMADGTLTKVRDYSHKGDYAQGWALYRFGCVSPTER